MFPVECALHVCWLDWASHPDEGLGLHERVHRTGVSRLLLHPQLCLLSAWTVCE